MKKIITLMSLIAIVILIAASCAPAHSQTPKATKHEYNNPNYKLDQSLTYYVTKTGTSYHTIDCSVVKTKETAKVTASWIQEHKEYYPCKKCLDKAPKTAGAKKSTEGLTFSKQ